MAEKEKALISKIILKYANKEPITIEYDGVTEYEQLDMQLFTEQLLKCKYNGFSVEQKLVLDYEMEKVTSIEYVFKPKY